MRNALWLVALVALARVGAEPWEVPWVEEEDLEEPYSEDREEDPRSAAADPPLPRARRHASPQPFDTLYPGYAPVKFHCCGGHTKRDLRKATLVRVPRQVHQYEVHEAIDEAGSYPHAPYEEMLAASANHRHQRMYLVSPPSNSAAAQYFKDEVSSLKSDARSVPSVTNNVRNLLLYSEPQQNPNPGLLQPFNKPSTQPPSPSPKLTLSFPLQDSKQNPVSFIAPPQSSISFAAPPAVVSDHSVVSKSPAVSFAPVSLNKGNAVPRSPTHFLAPSIGISESTEGLSIPGGVEIPKSPLAKLPVSSLGDGDLVGAAGGHVHHHKHHKKHGHGHSAGGGHSKHAGHHAAHGGKKVKGSHSHHHVDKGAKGHKTDENHKKEYEEAQGHKKKHHDHADYKGSHEEEAHGHRGAHFGEKKGHKKGHKTKGYHNKYHKDEFHKEHKFYDDFHKSGEHHRYGKFHAKHASDESGKKKAHHVNAGHDFVERGKKGYSNKGHMDADNKGYKGKHGHEEHHESHKNHGKKGGSEGGKEWGYAKKS